MSRVRNWLRDVEQHTRVTQLDSGGVGLKPGLGPDPEVTASAGGSAAARPTAVSTPEEHSLAGVGRSQGHWVVGKPGCDPAALCMERCSPTGQRGAPGLEAVLCCSVPTPTLATEAGTFQHRPRGLPVNQRGSLLGAGPASGAVFSFR